MSETNFPTPSAQATKGKNYKNAGSRIRLFNLCKNR
jgi:hypothetical protein